MCPSVDRERYQFVSLIMLNKYEKMHLHPKVPTPGTLMFSSVRILKHWLMESV